MCGGGGVYIGVVWVSAMDGRVVGVDVIQHHDVQAPQSLCCLLQQGYSWVMERVRGGGGVHRCGVGVCNGWTDGSENEGRCGSATRCLAPPPPPPQPPSDRCAASCNRDTAV